MIHGISSAQTDADNFYKSDKVNVEKVSFPNLYKMKVGANLFLPRDMKPGEKRSAVIVGHPMGAVKEQSADLYATKLAEQGFVTVRMGELNGNEKYYYLPDRLQTSASNPGTIHTGDLMLYGSDCLVLFYKTFATSYSYTRLGRLDNTSGLEAALGRGEVTVSFEPAE